MRLDVAPIPRQPQPLSESPAQVPVPVREKTLCSVPGFCFFNAHPILSSSDSIPVHLLLCLDLSRFLFQTHSTLYPFPPSPILSLDNFDRCHQTPFSFVHPALPSIRQRSFAPPNIRSTVRYYCVHTPSQPFRLSSPTSISSFLSSSSLRGLNPFQISSCTNFIYSSLGCYLHPPRPRILSTMQSHSSSDRAFLCPLAVPVATPLQTTPPLPLQAHPQPPLQPLPLS